LSVSERLRNISIIDGKLSWRFLANHYLINGVSAPCEYELVCQRREVLKEFFFTLCIYGSYRLEASIATPIPPPPTSVILEDHPHVASYYHSLKVDIENGDKLSSETFAIRQISIQRQTSKTGSKPQSHSEIIRKKCCKKNADIAADSLF
jgi:hypothetical protein